MFTMSRYDLKFCCKVIEKQDSLHLVKVFRFSVRSVVYRAHTWTWNNELI